MYIRIVLRKFILFVCMFLLFSVVSCKTVDYRRDKISTINYQIITQGNISYDDAHSSYISMMDEVQRLVNGVFFVYKIDGEIELSYPDDQTIKNSIMPKSEFIYISDELFYINESGKISTNNNNKLGVITQIHVNDSYDIEEDLIFEAIYKVVKRGSNGVIQAINSLTINRIDLTGRAFFSISIK